MEECGHLIPFSFLQIFLAKYFELVAKSVAENKFFPGTSGIIEWRCNPWSLFKSTVERLIPERRLNSFVNLQCQLCTDVDGSDKRHFLALLADEFSIYTPAFFDSKTFDDMKQYFLQLTWTDEDRRKELANIEEEKFDPSGSKSWEK